MGRDEAHPLVRSKDEPEAFTEFYRERYEPLVAYFARRVYDPEVALELTAETFAHAFIYRHHFRGDSQAQAEAWLYRIAERKLARYAKRGRAERRALERLRIEAPAVTAEQLARVSELGDLTGLRSVVASELSKLSRDQKEALRLRIVEDLSYPEVALALRISEPAARARVSRGLRSLAESLEANPAFREAGA